MYYTYIVSGEIMSNRTSHHVPPKRADDDLLNLSRKIETGFPSPASDHLEKALSLEELIVRRPTSTFYVRVEGHAMNASGIYEGDILVVDRSLSPNNDSILVVTYENEVIIRKLVKHSNGSFLVTGNSTLPPIRIDAATEWMIWGVVTHLIHRFS